MSPCGDLEMETSCRAVSITRGVSIASFVPSSCSVCFVKASWDGDSIGGSSPSSLSGASSAQVRGSCSGGVGTEERSGINLGDGDADEWLGLRNGDWESLKSGQKAACHVVIGDAFIPSRLCRAILRLVPLWLDCTDCRPLALLSLALRLETWLALGVALFGVEGFVV